MADNHQRQESPPCPFSLVVSEPSTSSCELAKKPEREDFMPPALLLQFNGTYPTGLEIPELNESPACAKNATEAARHGDVITESTPWTQNSNGSFNYGNETLYITIIRPWMEELLDPQSTRPTYSDQAQTPLAVWEAQSSTKEPFTNIGEVAMQLPMRQQEGKSSNRNHRRVRRKRLAGGDQGFSRHL